MSAGLRMHYVNGLTVASEFLRKTRILAEAHVEIAGSVRRRRKIVHDIDIVVPAELNCFVRTQCEALAHHASDGLRVDKWGNKLAAIHFRGVPVDLYFFTPGTFYTVLLIRTGSKENNIRLASIAKRRGWKLHASGEGLFNEHGERIAGDSERSIYDALGVPYQEPWEREVGR